MKSIPYSRANRVLGIMLAIASMLAGIALLLGADENPLRPHTVLETIGACALVGFLIAAITFAITMAVVTILPVDKDR